MFNWSLFAGLKLPGASKPAAAVALKKLNWRGQPLNDTFIKRGGAGAIWRQLPKVEIPRDVYTEMFSQKPSLLNQAAAAQPVSTGLYNYSVSNCASV